MYALMLHIYVRMELLGHREYICSALVELQKVFRSGVSVLQSYQQYMRILYPQCMSCSISLLAFGMVVIFSYSLLLVYIVASHSGFNLYFSDD